MLWHDDNNDDDNKIIGFVFGTHIDVEHPGEGIVAKMIEEVN